MGFGATPFYRVRNRKIQRSSAAQDVDNSLGMVVEQDEVVPVQGKVYCQVAAGLLSDKQYRVPGKSTATSWPPPSVRTRTAFASQAVVAQCVRTSSPGFGVMQSATFIGLLPPQKPVAGARPFATSCSSSALVSDCSFSVFSLADCLPSEKTSAFCMKYRP
jgi:hypothetical protein